MAATTGAIRGRMADNGALGIVQTTIEVLTIDQLREALGHDNVEQTWALVEALDGAECAHYDAATDSIVVVFQVT